MKRALHFFLLLIITSVLIVPVQAQDIPTIESGQTVTFEITKKNYEFPYQFTGKQGEYIVAYMQPTGFSNSIPNPVIQLIDSKNDIVFDTSDGFSPYGTTLALELPSDDTYTLIGTRQHGASGSDVGEFTLYFSRLEELSANQPITDELNTGSHNNYYLVHQSDHPLTLTYHKLDGDATPDIEANSIYRGRFLSDIRLGGRVLTQVHVLLPTNVDPIIISVGGIISLISHEEQKVSYKLTIS